SPRRACRSARTVSASPSVIVSFVMTPPFVVSLLMEQTRQDSNPGLRGWSSPCCRYTTGLWIEHARLESNQRPLPSHGSALCPLSYGRVRSPRQESNLHLGLTTGVCWPLTLRRPGSGDGGSRTRSSSVRARRPSPW